MADILIRGMEMPESCGMCDAQGLKNAIWHFGCGCAGDIDDFANCPPASCPIDSLPVKHGRLGDLDALEATMIDAVEKGYKAADLLLDIHFAPTIVPAEGGGEDG